ncbi:MAG: LysM peptidoglycan-binding domain-containing protein, partial [Caldilineaceae bacterium]|nr:LysM peptidoglycan-binding domain-containing protein [Caldilineaceae bacterium]
MTHPIPLSNDLPAKAILRLSIGLLLSIVALFWLGPAAANAQGSCPNPYTVRSGDYWTRIARECGVTLQALYNANPELRARRGDAIRPGDQVIIPISAQQSPPTPTARPAATAIPSPTPTRTTPTTRQDYGFYYTVVRGDTWSTIAARYNMALEDLYAYNGVWIEYYGDRRRIEPGDNILIPGRNGETIIPRGTTYTFQSGDTIFRIGQRTGYSLAQLEAANPGAWTNRNVIRPGTRIVIPASPSTIGSSPPSIPTAVGGQPCRADNTPYATNITVGDLIEVVSFGPNTDPNIV